jgi:hypothetical protein
MALISCPECGRQVSDQAPTCVHCGYPLQTKREGPGTRWEYQDVVIPIDLRFKSLEDPDEPGFLDQYSYQPRNVAEIFDQLVLAAFQDIGRDGWQPEGPTDLRSLFFSKRIDWDYERATLGGVIKSGLGAMFNQRVMIELILKSARIRVRRLTL